MARSRIKRLVLRNVARVRRQNDLLVSWYRAGENWWLVDSAHVIARSNNIPVLKDTQIRLQKLFRSMKALKRSAQNDTKRDFTMENQIAARAVAKETINVLKALQSVNRRLKGLKGKKVKRLAEQP